LLCNKHIKKSKTWRKPPEKQQAVEKTALNEQNTPVNNAKNENENYNTFISHDNRPEKTMVTKYCCDYCQFVCNTKKEAEKHRKSKEHVKNENKEEDFIEIVNKYFCVKCDKIYLNYKTCWGHSKRCQGKKENIVMEITDILSETEDSNLKESICPTVAQMVAAPEMNDENTKKDIIVTIVEKMMDNNKQMIDDNNKYMMEQIVTVVKTILQEIKSQPIMNQTNIQNNTDNRVTNNHCTMNVFLNEKCKDAMNMFDFITNMNITFDHLYHQADNGFQKGVTKILLDNLKPLSIYNRPIHFTDLKREIMYIKDNDEWTKHEDKEKLVEALEWAAKQGINSFVDWREATSAENESLESPTGQMWMKLMQTVVQPHNERMKAYPKIMKEIARNVHLRKEDQT
jgi:hypothetical protein